MIKRPSGERRDARNADNRRPGIPCLRVRKLPAIRRVLLPCARRVPIGLYGIEPLTLLRKKATHDPYSASALFDFSVVRSELLSNLPGDMPTGVIPDEKQDSLASRLEPLATPRKEPRGYGTNRPPVHEPQPRLLVEFGQVEALAGYGLRSFAGVIFGNRPLDETLGFPFFAPATQGRQGHPAPPAFILETYCPFGIGSGRFHQPVAASFLS